jgi:ribosomal protein S18 acetylase RimI-like enzyme
MSSTPPRAVTFRVATLQDVPAITAIETDVAIRMPSERAIYPNIDRYNTPDRARVWKYNYLVDFYCKNLVIIVAETTFTESSKGHEKKVIGFLCWEYEPGDPSRSKSSFDRRGKAGPLYDLLPKDTLWRRFLCWWYIKCHDVVHWLDRSRERSTTKEYEACEEKACNGLTQKEFEGLFKREHWYLLDFAIHPDYQRLGIGSDMVRWGMDRMKTEKSEQRERMVMLQANPGTQTFYRERFGFKEVGEWEFRGFRWNMMVCEPSTGDGQ